MSQTALFWPAFAQVILIVVVMLAMGRARARSMRALRKTPDDVALNRASDWDDDATKAANNYKNQFEMPALFFAAIAMALALKMSDGLLVVLAWVFVATRAVHAAIHLTFNKTLVRAAVWLLSVATVLMMWFVLAARVANAG
jgi:hypothetical protein